MSLSHSHWLVPVLEDLIHASRNEGLEDVSGMLQEARQKLLVRTGQNIPSIEVCRASVEAPRQS